ncbi:MAG TPA: UbiD family decarboxylase [Chloroflexota bacterium]|nr:UbiD family decarboxylase [Chloroflexota bacterium]
MAVDTVVATRRDLRAHIAQLEAAGKLIRVSRPINKDTEMHPLVRWQFRGLPESQRKAFLFENVEDTRGRQYDMPVLVAALAGSEDIYAMSMGCSSAEVLDTWKRALANPLPAVVVEDAPVQEVVYSGDSLLEKGGLDELPVPISTPGFDNAPYFNSAIWITRDPETGIRNAGVYRGMLKSPTRTGVFCDTSNNTAMNWEKHNALGRPMEAAAVIGSPPAVYLSAIQMAPVGVDELAVAGAILGQPVETVRCKTVDLGVPAYAEIVVEGIIRTDVLEPEGSFGEAHGYQDPRSLSFSFEVTAITHRRDPIFLSILSQVTPSESSKTKQSGYEAQILRYLRETCGLRGVTRVSYREDLMNRQVCVIVLNKVDKFEPMNALYSMLSTRQTPKIIVAVDEDIDPTNDTMVNWAIVNRSQPHRDLKVIHPRVTQFGPLRYVDNYDRDDSCILIDATRKADFPPVALPAREYMEHARELWEELGLPKLEPRTPWHGYSLGRWPDEQAEEAKLATQGRYFETGEKLINRAQPAPPGTNLREARRHDLH